MHLGSKSQTLLYVKSCKERTDLLVLHLFTQRRKLNRRERTKVERKQGKEKGGVDSQDRDT